MPLVKEREQAQRLLLAKKNYAPSLKTRAKNAARVLFSPFKRPYDLLWRDRRPKHKVLLSGALASAGLVTATSLVLGPWFSVPIAMGFGGALGLFANCAHPRGSFEYLKGDIFLGSSFAVLISALMIGAPARGIHELGQKVSAEIAVQETVEKMPELHFNQGFQVEIDGTLCDATVSNVDESVQKNYKTGETKSSHTLEITVPSYPKKSFWTGKPAPESLTTRIERSGPYHDVQPQ